MKRVCFILIPPKYWSDELFYGKSDLPGKGGTTPIHFLTILWGQYEGPLCLNGGSV